MTAASLRHELEAVFGSHPLVTQLQPGHGVSASVPVDAVYERVDGAVAVARVLSGEPLDRLEADATFLDVTFDAADLILWTMRGGRFEATYPPAAFRPVARTVHPRLPFPLREAVGVIEFGSEDGRSSDGDMPFFLVTEPSGRAGLWFALGWSGGWRGRLIKLPRQAAHRLSVEGTTGQFTVGAGQHIELPRVFVGAFHGDGWRAIREFLSRMAPRRSQPWVVYNTWFNESAAITEARVLAHVEVAAEIGVEVFCVDAAWYDTSDDPSSFNTRGLGTWEVDRAKFPNGLEPVAEAVRAAGMRFGLWFEPERAHPRSTVWRNHADWIRSAGQEFGLVDFGVPAAREAALDLVSRAVDGLGIGWLKWDMNLVDVTPFWRGDAWAELAHIRGLYAVLDELRRRHPELIVEACASGGNRLDVELLSRSDTCWLSDQTVSPDIVRATLANARRLLPSQYGYLSVAPQPDGDPVDYPDEWFVGVMNGVFGIMDRLSRWPPGLRAKAKRHIRRFKEIRHLLDGELALLGDSSEVPLAAWDAWEWSDPSTGEAALFAFRLDAEEPERTFTGRHRWTVRLPPRGATVLTRAGVRDRGRS